MPAKKRGLGRGLDSLLSSSRAAKEQQDSNQARKEDSIRSGSEAGITAPADQQTPATGTKPAGTPGEVIRQIPVEFIRPGKYQPRLDLRPETLEELAASIKAQGLMQPIVVRTLGTDSFEIIAGERRWRASQLAGLDKIPSIVRDVADDAAIAMALIENIQRENLNPMEEAMALRRLQDEFELTQQEVADAVGKSRTTVTNLLRLMTLVPEVRTYLEHGDLEMGHARALLGLKEDAQAEAARAVISRSLNVRQTEALVRSLQSGTPGKTKPHEDPDVRMLQDNLSDKLGTPVHIQHTPGGKGKLILKYNSLDELDGILSHIR